MCLLILHVQKKLKRNIPVPITRYLLHPKKNEEIWDQLPKWQQSGDYGLQRVKSILKISELTKILPSDNKLQIRTCSLLDSSALCGNAMHTL